jgi:hypothetical protein
LAFFESKEIQTMGLFNFWKNTEKEETERALWANRCVSSEGTRDWYNGSRYVYTHHKDGSITTDGPYIEGHEQTDWQEGPHNYE